MEEPWGAHKPGGAPRWLVAHPWVFWPLLQASWVPYGPRKISVEFYSVWTPFDIPFLQYSKTRKKQKLALGTRLIG